MNGLNTAGREEKELVESDMAVRGVVVGVSSFFLSFLLSLTRDPV